MLKRKNKQHLPWFMLTFKMDEDINRIYKVNIILGMKVVVERKSQLILQYRNCQAFGHIKSIDTKTLDV